MCDIVLLFTTDVDNSVETLKGEIKGLHRWFNCVKESTIKCLEKCRIAVMTVVYLLTSILSVDEHSFLKRNTRFFASVRITGSCLES